MARAISDHQILEAALAVIVKQGYAGATTREIAATAGINEVTLFRRFGSKQKLLTAVVEQEAENFIAAGIEYSGDVTADLLRVVRFYQNIVQHRGRVIAMMMTELPRHPELGEIMQTPMQIVGRVIAILARYQQEGKLVAEPPFQAFLALVGPLFLEGVLGAVGPNLLMTQLDPVELVDHYLQGRVSTRSSIDKDKQTNKH